MINIMLGHNFLSPNNCACEEINNEREDGRLDYNMVPVICWQTLRAYMYVRTKLMSCLSAVKL